MSYKGAPVAAPGIPPVLDFRGNPMQEEFVFCTEPNVAYAGAIRSGKTVGACARVLFHAQVYPGSQILVGRKFFTDLESTTLKELFRLIAAQNGGTARQPGPAVVRFEGGSGSFTVYLRTKGEPSVIHCRPCNEIGKQLGLEISEAFLDQAEELDEEVFNHITSRLSYWNAQRIAEFRQKYGYAPRKWVTLTANPDPGWIKSLLFEEQAKKWKLFETDIEKNRANLGPGFIEELYATHPAEWCDRFLKGDWNIRGGAVYKEFDESVHAIQSFRIPDHWSRFLAHDWGISDRHRCVFLWGAVDENGRLYVTRELSVTDTMVSKVAEAVHQITMEDPAWPRESDGALLAAMDPATNQRHGTGRTVRDEFALHRILGHNANNDVNAGINKVMERLHIDGRYRKPGMYIFKDKCPRLIRGLKIYQWIPPNSDGIAPGKPIKKDDDECLVGSTFVQTRKGLCWIQVVCPGDYVLGQGGFKKVKAAACTGRKIVMKVEFSDGSSLTGTPNHPIWRLKAEDGGEFVSLNDLQDGDSVLTKDGRLAVLRVHHPAPYRERGPHHGLESVYNLTVEGGTYYANGVLVHNCDTLRYMVMDVLEHNSTGIPTMHGNADSYDHYVVKEFMTKHAPTEPAQIAGNGFLEHYDQGGWPWFEKRR